MNNKKNILYIIIVALTVASISFRMLNGGGLEQTSLLFVGIPSLITLLIVRYTKKPKSAYGIMFLTITIFLLISGIFLGEGFICILMMAPIFYGVSAILVAIYLLFNKKDKDKTYSFIIFPIIILLLNPSDYINEVEVHSIKTLKEVNEDVTLSKLNSEPDFLQDLPLFFKAGFPTPIGIEGKGIAVGDIRKIEFESTTKGVGVLVLEIKEKTEKSIVFKINSDKTHINHWLTYKEIKVELIEAEGKKKISWTTDFICDLGPSWYFEGFEKYAISLMNEHLINSYFIAD